MPALQADFADCTHAEMLVFADCIDVDNHANIAQEGDQRAGCQAFPPTPPAAIKTFHTSPLTCTGRYDTRLVLLATSAWNTIYNHKHELLF